MVLNVKGEITGADEVSVEGDVNVKMDTNKLTIGSTGKLRGKINANTVEVKWNHKRHS